jgi:hypothetical protein
MGPEEYDADAERSIRVRCLCREERGKEDGGPSFFLPPLTEEHALDAADLRLREAKAEGALADLSSDLEGDDDDDDDDDNDEHGHSGDVETEERDDDDDDGEEEEEEEDSETEDHLRRQGGRWIMEARRAAHATINAVELPDGAEASANNETTRASADPLTMKTQQGLRMLGAAPSGGATYSTTLVDAVAAPGSDGRAVLAPGAASVPHRFFSPGLYLWHDQRNTAIHGVIVVEPSDIAVDACGVCGGDNSTCIDCLGVPHGAARLDACGVCSDPTAGYTPNPAIDCAGVCHGSAALDGCGECTGGTTGRLTGASMDCAGVCGGTARVDCEGVCGGSGWLDWHEGRPSSTIDIGCTDNEGCCTQLSLPPPHSQLSHVFLYEG